LKAATIGARGGISYILRLKLSERTNLRDDRSGTKGLQK